MARRLRDRERRKVVRAFAAGLGCGLLAGALLVLVVGRHFGGAISPRTAAFQRDTKSAIGPDDVEKPASTIGSAAAVPAPASEGAAARAPASAKELAGRDLDIPVEGVKPQQLKRSFFDARSGHLHGALDILAPEGTPVKAVEEGTIAKLFLSKAGGTTIYQFDPSGLYCYYYAHLQRYADGLQEGQTVTKGQVIGYVGTTGNAPKNTPHLHFAIYRLTPERHWWEGTPIDPYDVLR